MLYPLKFRPIYKHYVWGGKKLADFKNIKSAKTISESWELSAIGGSISVVSNGFLAGNNLQEIIEIYMGDLVGEKIYEKYGIEFPLLLKFIDAAQSLSVQVHPNDDVALQRHNAYGKEEMWYVADAENDAEIFVGFNQKMDKEKLIQSLQNNNLLNLLNSEKIKKGDVFEVPSGRVHAIGKGSLIAEIQNTSDITYRIYDWGREHTPQAREMHIDLALDVIDYNVCKSHKVNYTATKNNVSKLCANTHFNVNIIDAEDVLLRDYAIVDSFVAYMCVDGNLLLECNGKTETIRQGETVLIPAEIDEVKLIPKVSARLLEITM
jgi:mannose-6-phosphate isomerase